MTEGGGEVLLSFYSRPGCHLCEQAIGILEEILKDLPAMRLEEINIEADDVLHSQYLERIPVVAYRGNILAELDISRTELEEAVRRVASMSLDELRD